MGSKQGGMYPGQRALAEIPSPRTTLTPYIRRRVLACPSPSCDEWFVSDQAYRDHYRSVHLGAGSSLVERLEAMGEHEIARYAKEAADA